MSTEQINRVTVRLFNTGSVGDCILLLFWKKELLSFRMLIDCGGYNTSAAPIQAVVKNIINETGGELDLLVVTHQHEDHISGFNLARDLFDQIDVKEVWMSWVEDETDPIAKILKRRYEKKLSDLKKKANQALKKIKKLGQSHFEAHGINVAMKMRQENLKATVELLEFENRSYAMASGGRRTNNDAMTYVKSKGKKLQFKIPGDTIDKVPGGEGLRFYVLGPPREEDLKHLRMEEIKDEMYAIKRTQMDQEQPVYIGDPIFPTGSILEEDCSPFRDHFIAKGKQLTPLEKQYQDANMKWRQIEGDWLEMDGEAALALTRFVNNTSLALAIEIQSTGQVILLPADAQSGNWISWKFPAISEKFTKAGGKSVKDLLANTVLYKVGHHGSHNGTASISGLEAMTHSDLVALMPLVQSKVPAAWGGAANFPAKSLYNHLIQKTRGRLSRIDEGIVNDHGAKDLREDLSATDQQTFKKKMKVTPLYIEYTL